MPRSRRGRGEGSIFQRADGRWAATISVGYTDAGRRRRKTVYGPSKKAVQDKLKALDAEAVISDPGRLTVGEYLDRWLSQAVKPTTAPATHARYKAAVENQLKPKIGGLRLTMIRPIHVEQLYRSLDEDGCSARGQQLAGITLGRALKHAVRLRLIAFNPVREVDKPRVPKTELSVWDRSQASTFLQAAAGDRLEALYVVALGVGLRQGELLGLQWPDVDFDAGTLTVRRSLEELSGKLRLKETKTGRGRRIDLPQFVAAALSRHRAAMLAEGHIAAPVFCDTQGGFLRKGNLSRRSFVPLVAKSGLPPIRFHDLRHTCATLLLSEGVNPKIVAEILGHSKVQVTLDTYSHVLPTMQRDAAARMQGLLG